MKITLKEIARRANVSITTVSHVVNRTRYVKPEVAERIMKIIEETGYHHKNKPIDRKMAVLLVPSLKNPFFAQLADSLNRQLVSYGKVLSVFATNDTDEQERILLQDILPKMDLSSLYLATDRHHEQELQAIHRRNIQVIYLRKFRSDCSNPAACYDGEHVYAQATHTLLQCGHRKILFLFSNTLSDLETEQKLAGCKKMLAAYKIPTWNQWIYCSKSEESLQNFLSAHLHGAHAATAVLCGSPKDTFTIMDFLKTERLAVPDKISIIGTLDSRIHMEMYPDLSAITEMPEPLAEAAMRITAEETRTSLLCYPQFSIGKSIRSIHCGQDGSPVADPEVLELTEYEIREIQKRKYSICVAFHDTSSDLTKTQEMGIRHAYSKLHIEVKKVTHAGYQSALQAQQIESMLLEKPDAIIVLPVNDVKIRGVIRRIVQSKTKLILLSNFPRGIPQESYVTYVGDNDLDSGRIIGHLLGEHFQNHASANIALFPYAPEAFSSNRRDLAVERVLREEFLNLHFTARVPFHTLAGIHDIAKTTLLKYPEIDAIYTTWEQSACKILHVLRELGRTDIVIVTADLGLDVAVNIAQHGPIVGLSAQRPYEQGEAAVMAAANAFLDRKVPSYIGIQPIAVTNKNIAYVWKEIMKTKEPPQFHAVLKQNASIFSK